ncbi:MAG TPA: flagellar motor switch protein FliG [Burkholderiaceae bacterium]|nr:flagellar motor switch protein FliG [Burkholderiaceae bacterium]
MDDEGVMQSAILLMSLGQDEAAEVFKHLTPKEVQRLGETMAKLKSVTREQVDSVLALFREQAGAQAALVGDTDEYVRQVLMRALGEEKASLLIDRILQGSDVSGIESLRWMDANAIAELLRNEHPQIVASVLVHLDREQSASVLACFTDRLRNEVIMRIATLDGIQPTALKELNETLSKVLAGGDKVRKAAMGGIKTAAEIVNGLAGSMETAVLDSIREQDEDLAQKIMDQLFTFDDLLNLDNQAMQLMLREVQTDSLIVALKGAGNDLREKVFSNMSQRAAETMRDDLESKGPVRLSEVEAQQKEIIRVVRRLADEGQIMLGSGGEDAFV